MIAAFISSLSQAFGVFLDKKILSKEHLSLRVFLPISFIFAFLFTLVLVPFLGGVDWDVAFLPNTLFLLFLMVVIGIAWNVLLTQNLQKERVHQHELILMSAPLITIILARIFYPEDFNMTVFILALIASVALLFSKTQKEHFFNSAKSWDALLAVILMSTEALIIRELLYSYTPVALYAIRTLFIALFFMAYYRPRYAKVAINHWWMIAFSSILGMVQMLTKFYAYSQFGLVYTTLITILAPIIVFLISWEFLHEKIKPRVVIASIIILACAVGATLVTAGIVSW